MLGGYLCESAKFNIVHNACLPNKKKTWSLSAFQTFSSEGGGLVCAWQYPLVSKGLDWIEINILRAGLGSDQIGQLLVKI